MLRVVTFHREIRSGSSLPLVVSANDGRRYVLKARGSGDGLVANAVDWLGSGLAGLFGIPRLEPHALLVEPGFETQAEDPEIRELLERSHGANFATRWIENAKSPSVADLDRLDGELRRRVLLFDLLLLNIDRHATNPNAIVDSGGFHFLDFSAAMALRALFSGAQISQEPFLTQLRRHPFFADDIETGPFIERAQEITRQELVRLVEELPREWAHGCAIGRQEMVDAIFELLAGAAVLRDRLAAVATTPLETDADRRRRSEANKAKFSRRLAELTGRSAN